MKKLSFLFYCVFLLTSALHAQVEVHSTQFMLNKLIFNPAYAGSRDVATISADYRNQWNAIKGAPKTTSVSFDAPVGDYNSSFRDIAAGFSFSNEQIGVETKQNLAAYYAFRIKMKNESVLSLGLSAGAQMYSANYNELDPYQQNDPNLAKNVIGTFLPDFGVGCFWYANDYYIGASVPNLIQNYYDNSEKRTNDIRSRQVRGYYANGGYVFHASENWDVLPQLMARYVGNGNYQLPFNLDFNVSFIMNNRFLLGATYRTDKSFEAIVHFQCSRKIYVGYAFDYLISGLSGYNNGAHELVVGFNFIKGDNLLENPHFSKSF